MGLDSFVMEGGSQISGGQRQRVMIARALVNRPRLFFLDEATSALDNRTQAIVGESLAAMNATRIVIAHRLSTIRDADRILVLEGGRIVEIGTYDELMASAAPSSAWPSASCSETSSRSCWRPRLMACRRASSDRRSAANRWISTWLMV